MEGISKESLLEYRSLKLSAEELLDRIIDECKELGPSNGKKLLKRDRD